MELESYYLKNLKKNLLIKFITKKTIKQLSLIFLSFWLLFKSIKKNNVLGFILGILIADGNFPYLLLKKNRKSIYFLGLKVIMRKNFIRFLQKFIFLYFTGLENFQYLFVKFFTIQNIVILKQEFPYSSELDLFLDTIMRELKANIFSLIITITGLNYWYYFETFSRSLNIPIYFMPLKR